jgi:CelD/BcsL family acetyltransferase involved in cellulose biosynthesis
VTFSTEWVTDESRFAGLSGEWEALLAPGARPFDLHCWHTAWWRAFGNGRELAICTVRDGGTLAGVFPLLRRGRELEALANVHSNGFRPFASGPEAMNELIDAALQGATGLTLTEMWDGDAYVDPLAAGVRNAGMMPLFETGSVSPIVDTSGDLDIWVTQHNSSWKKRLRRYRRKMYKDYEATFEIARLPADLEAELVEGFELEESGWKGRAGTAIVSRPDTEAFYRELATAFHARDELRLSRIALDGKPVAFSFCIEHGGSLYSLKAGYDESFRKIVPGLVMQVSIVEACFERGLDAYELLGEQTEWKAKLATSQRSHSTLRAYRRHPAGLARYTYRAALRPRLRRLHRRLSRSG